MSKVSKENGKTEKVMKKYGVDYEMIVGEGMFHCYPAFPIVKEAQEGWDKMVDLIRNTTKQGSIKNAI